MAHYALINSNNIVIHVITGLDENVIQTESDGTQVGGTTEAWEQFYSTRPWFAGLTCKRTSYNGNIRKNYATIGGIYDPDFDVFIAPRPYPSWKLNYTTYQWDAPVARPDEIEGYVWGWSEYNQEWIKISLT
jgi:hypothetical protein